MDESKRSPSPAVPESGPASSSARTLYTPDGLRYKRETTPDLALLLTLLPPPQPCPSPPSPAPTEIVTPELTQEEIVEDVQRMGIKVRDFAYEPLPPGGAAIECFDARGSLRDYRSWLFIPPYRRRKIEGRVLRRLLDMGFVSEFDDSLSWQACDWAALDDFDARPKYPWKPVNDCADDLDKIPFINGPPKPSRAYDRPDHASSLEKRALDTSEDGHPPANLPKKLRFEDGSREDTAAEPVSVQHTPLALIDGKPPQQFPAGDTPIYTCRSPPPGTPLAQSNGSPKRSTEHASDGPHILRPPSTPVGDKQRSVVPSDSPRTPSRPSHGRSLERQATSSLFLTDLRKRSDSLTESAQS